MTTKSRWEMDPAHSSVEFSVKHMMMTTVRGRFREVTGAILLDEDNPANASVEVEIDAASIDTGVADRDTHLRSADFLDADNHPKLTFRSKRVEGSHKEEGSRFRVIGDLTIRGTAMEVELDCVFEGRGRDPWGNEKAGFSATGELDRREWGLKWNQALEAGGILVANKVKIDVEAQFMKKEAKQEAAA